MNVRLMLEIEDDKATRRVADHQLEALAQHLDLS